jgi:hypothetical protein
MGDVLTRHGHLKELMQNLIGLIAINGLESSDLCNDLFHLGFLKVIEHLRAVFLP